VGSLEDSRAITYIFFCAETAHRENRQELVHIKAHNAYSSHCFKPFSVTV